MKNFEDKKIVLLAQVYQTISQILKSLNLKEYYSVYSQTGRKRSEDNINLIDEPSPYLERKRKWGFFVDQREADLRRPSRYGTV